jgi:hypothetical protein
MQGARFSYFLLVPFARAMAGVLFFPLGLSQTSAHHFSIAGRRNRSIFAPSLTNGIG